MLRSIGSVVGGYVVVAVIVMVTFSIALLLMGVDRVYAEGTYDVSMMWIVVSFVLGLLGAIVGGLVSAKIARTATPPKVLAALMFILGFAQAFMTIGAREESEAPILRGGDVGILEAMTESEQPTWVMFVNPFLGAVGVLMGACFVKKKTPGAPSGVAPPTEPTDAEKIERATRAGESGEGE